MASRNRRAALTSGIAALFAVTGLGLGAAPAQADPPSNPVCNPDRDYLWEDIVSARVEPTVTYFVTVAVAPGTTGQYTRTLTETETVTTSVNGNTEVTAEFKALFAKVSVKVGFSVTDTKSTTWSATASDTWNFNDPGYYGMYRGTRKVTGEWVRYICARSGPGIGYWVKSTPGGPGTFTTFETTEYGTVSCASPEPAGTVRAAARLRLLTC
ncbi:hypothetical protein GCM10009639_40890 [Kitasatospora putterlickiae]|uniref:Secreted protein n=1 Tax=Kitasatospora putterlickiae TaxID=221725 RepID=A0ABN1Y7S5_9ACTN